MTLTAKRASERGDAGKASKPEAAGERVIRIPRGDLAKNPFRYLSDPPRMPGEKRAPALISDDED